MPSRRALVLCGVLLCCTPGPVSSRDGAAESPAARRVDGPAESEDVGGGTADSRLAQLRTLERVLAMEVSAVDALSRVQHDRGRRRETAERGVLRSAEGMWMRLFSQLEEEGEDEFAEMRCAEALSLHRSAASDDERARVCAFVDARCSPRTGFFNYLAVPFCWFSTFPWLGALVLLLALAVMFAWIIAMVDFLIPALATLSKLCYLRQSVAGVTFLAFGNGCSDIFSMTAATLTGVKGMELAVGEVLGNGMLIFCFIQGIIAIITPFTANASEYLRDCGFYFLSLLLVAVVLFDGHISSVEGGMFLGLYAIYVVVVLNYERVLQALGMHPLDAEVMPQVGVPAATEREKLIDEDAGAKPGFNSAVNDLYSHVVPVKRRRWREMEWYEAALLIVQLPIIVLLRLCVPVVSDELPKDGWSRSVSTMQMLILPVVVSAAIMSRHVLPTDGEWVWAVAVIGGGLLLGATLAVIMWVYTEDETPPRWHKYMCFVGFAAAVLFIYMTAAEIVNIILAFGVVFEVGNFSLGVSILAIGIGMQDLVSNIGVARAGYPNMAASACIGAPLLNILLGLGVCAIAGNAFVANPYPLSLSTQLLVCLFFLLGSVALAVSFMLFYDYRADFSMGALLVSLYVVFLVVTLALDEYDTDAYGSAAAAKASVDARGGRGDFEPIST